ncbi:MAG: aminotransferase class I/II-fold pyridoxal phosphate-dependent enzyme [candidate division Zixibacteria bacterium]|nr:aminotransferase class I/II-fold pyridoxal phosphate-dependent enzyme [candidate division Zixibacteria bacterium]
MIPTSTTDIEAIGDPTEFLSGKLMVDRDMLMLFADGNAFLVELLKLFYRPACRLVSAGLMTPEVQIAADRADLTPVEVISESPFLGNTAEVLKAAGSTHDIIYVANPNRLTGMSFSLGDLEKMSRAVPDGLIIIDEYYVDHTRITALPLLDLFSNVVILRSFASSGGLKCSDAGYAITGPERCRLLKTAAPTPGIPTTLRKSILAALIHDQELTRDLREIHDESLHMATELNRLGLQSRICATDWLLMRVQDTKAAGNFLARHGVRVENLDGYPGLSHYIRYRIRPHLNNDPLIEAFKKMPPAFYRMKSLDLRAQALRLARHDADEEMGRLRFRDTAKETPGAGKSREIAKRN